nr:unnamed protein product [Callosobruchus analis]
MKVQISLVKKIVAEVLHKVEQMVSKQNIAPKKDIISLEEALGISFPIGCEEDLWLLEKKLEDVNTLTKVASELAKIGGKTPYEFIKRATTSILKDEVLLPYSWYGRKGNKIFKTMKIAKILIGEYCYIITVHAL